jgi:hypothetical protein
MPCSKTAPELDASDEDSIIDHNHGGVVSDREGSGIEDDDSEEGMEGDSDGETPSHGTKMPTATNCPAMESMDSLDCRDTSTLAVEASHLSANRDEALLIGSSRSSINIPDGSLLESTNFPFINDHADTSTPPSIESHSASTTHPSVNSHVTTTIFPSINSCDPGTSESEMQPFFLASEPTRAGRIRKCRDMSSLSLCLCGASVAAAQS